MRFFITPKLVFVTLAVVIGLSLVGFVVSGVNRLAGAPLLEITSPNDRSTINSDSTLIVGKTEAGASVAINEEPVTLSENGQFKEKVVLKPGVNAITVTAKNKSGKQASSTLLVESKPAVSKNN